MDGFSKALFWQQIAYPFNIGTSTLLSSDLGDYETHGHKKRRVIQLPKHFDRYPH